MGGMPSLGMDDMMGKMMSNMGSMSMNSSSSKMSSSSFSSSSSSSMMSSEMSSMMGGMPPMRGMQMPASAAPSMGAPEYTVTSPPMSPPPPEMNHKVQKTDDYVPPTTQTAEATVLLKVKEGDKYKLALNMQQYSPED